MSSNNNDGVILDANLENNANGCRITVGDYKNLYRELGHVNEQVFVDINDPWYAEHAIVNKTIGFITVDMLESVFVLDRNSLMLEAEKTTINEMYTKDHYVASRIFKGAGLYIRENYTIPTHIYEKIKLEFLAYNKGRISEEDLDYAFKNNRIGNGGLRFFFTIYTYIPKEDLIETYDKPAYIPSCDLVVGTNSRAKNFRHPLSVCENHLKDMYKLRHKYNVNTYGLRIVDNDNPGISKWFWWLNGPKEIITEKDSTLNSGIYIYTDDSMKSKNISDPIPLSKMKEFGIFDSREECNSSGKPEMIAKMNLLELESKLSKYKIEISRLATDKAGIEKDMKTREQEHKRRIQELESERNKLNKDHECKMRDMDATIKEMERKNKEAERKAKMLENILKTIVAVVTFAGAMAAIASRDK